MGEQYTWDFFLAHSSTDKDAAEALYDLLSPPFNVFLDSRSLLPGDNWDVELAVAKSRAAVTLVLVSSRTEDAYYQREEIAAAIDMARRSEDRHRVVPIFLDAPGMGAGLPYGLRLKQGLSVPEVGGLEEVARRIKKLQGLLAMPASEIRRRYESRALVGHAVRLIPQADYDPAGLLGHAVRKYVFVGDYDEQRHRTLRQVLSNLWIGDAFERVENSNVRWLAVIFELGELNRRKLDLMPATWKAAFRILSDPSRAACFSASDEERAKLGRPPRDYYSDDQRDFWYRRLTISERRDTDWGIDYYLVATLGISWLCFSGTGITQNRENENPTCIPSRVFFVRNVPFATINYRLQELGVLDDNIVLQ
jgi:TIR domain